MTAEANRNPIGIEDPDGRVWPFNHHFSPQMADTGCKPIYSRASYTKKLMAQVKKDREFQRKQEREALEVRSALFDESGPSENREPVDVNAASTKTEVKADS